MNTKQIAQQLIDDDVLIIDTETTGLGEFDYVVEFAAVNLKNNKAYETIVKPPVFDCYSKDQWTMFFGEAEAIHKISHSEIARNGITINAAVEYLKINNVNASRLGAFNAIFDERLINQTLNRSEFICDNVDIQHCIMELANRHLARDHAEWNKEDARFKRLNLARCCEIMGIEFEGKAHRALSDAKATAALVHAIANDV